MSLYQSMRDSNHPSLKVFESNKPVIKKSRLLKDIEDGNKPENYHIPLDYYFEKK